MVGLSRMISLAARSGCTIQSIIDQLSSCGTCPSYAVRRATKHDTSNGNCCPMAVGNAILDMWREMQEEVRDGEDEYEETSTDTINELVKVQQDTKPTCPECGEPVIFEGGCVTCKNCGYSKCN